MRRMHLKRALARLTEASAHLIQADLLLDLAHESERDAKATAGVEALHATIARALSDAKGVAARLERELAEEAKREEART